MNATYRYKRSVWIAGLTLTCVAQVFLGVFCVAMLKGVDPDAPAYAWGISTLFLVALFATFFLSGIYYLVRGIRHRLTIKGDCVESVSPFGIGQVDLTNIDVATWQIGGNSGDSRLVLKGPSQRLKIAFSDYTNEEACQLIKFFRLRLPESIQKGWDTYWPRHWWLFDHPDPTQRERFAAETRSLRRRLLALVAGATVMALAIMIVVWCYMGDLLPPLSRQLVGLLIAPVMVTPFIFRIRISRGPIADQFTPERKKSLLPAFACLFLVLSFMLAIGLAVFDIPGGQLALLIGGVGTVGTLFPGAILQGVAAQRANLEAARAAEEAYMRP